MSIRIDEKSRLFSLETAHTLYQIKADEMGVLLHLWYGPRTDADMSYRIRTAHRGFCGNPYEAQDRLEYSLDTLPQEYSGSGVGDFRVSAVQATAENGSRGVDLRYRSHRLLDGAPAPVFKCGGMYMGVALTAGEHTVDACVTRLCKRIGPYAPHLVSRAGFGSCLEE